MTYQQSIDWLFSQLPMYQRIGKAAYKADLSTTLWLMDELNHPEKRFKSIHVAGTNGKGSTSHLLASIFQEAGYKTGLYTSPHLVDFRERIRINGEMISENEVTNFIQKHKSTFESRSISFFEWTVALAFDYFANQEVDIAIVEVGMGGRLDSTNVVHPELSIITNIGHDHSQFLGDTLALIAGEKAGIIKPNVPVLIGKRQLETEDVFRNKAIEVQAPVFFAEESETEALDCPLRGSYQSENFRTVQAAIQLLSQSWNISTNNIELGFINVLKNTQLQGRWQTLSNNPLIICDVGHNKEGLVYNIEQLASYEKPFAFLLGFVNDKSVVDILQLFPKDGIFILTEPNIPRALPINELQNIAISLGLNHITTNTAKSGVQEYYNSYANDHNLYVGGSTFIVSDILKVWS